MDKIIKEKNEKIYICQPGDSNDDSSYFEEEENDEYLSIDEELNQRKGWRGNENDEIESINREIEESISIEQMFEKIDIEAENENVIKDFIYLNDYFARNPNKRKEHQVSFIYIYLFLLIYVFYMKYIVFFLR